MSNKVKKVIVPGQTIKLLDGDEVFVVNVYENIATIITNGIGRVMHLKSRKLVPYNPKIKTIAIKQGEKMEKKNIIKIAVAGGVVLVGGIIAAFTFVEMIDNGQVGIRYSINGGVRDEALGQGVHFVGIDRVTQFPIHLQSVHATGLNVSTSDGRSTNVSFRYTYRIDPTKASLIFREFGSLPVEDIEEGWMTAELLRAARQVISQHNLLQLAGEESVAIQNEIKALFEESIARLGFVLDNLTLGAPQLDDDTQAMINGIIQAGQAQERARLEAETARINADRDADVARTNADAEAYVTERNATAQAQANRELAESITPDLIRMAEAEARKLHGWVTVNGADAVVVGD
ncbi:MAG: prohibitin family protein [Streptococcaceae bacterium]|jgi:regulator of protease activity HflC (stomatin/prohibitin superfamily)|nr:prohibitin family protein [Streptococcaceae bacterium]